MKKNNLALFTILIIWVFSLFTLNIFAQRTNSVKVEQTQETVDGRDVLENYIYISSLPTDKRKIFFNNLSSEEKANLFELHLAMQFVNRPNLTKEQNDSILDSILMITPDSYKESSEKLEETRRNGHFLGQNAMVIFSKKEFFEIFGNLGSEKNEINLLQKYINVSDLSVPQWMDTIQKFSADDKSNFWKVHLALTLAKSPNLKRQQMEIILEVIKFATPEIYEISRNDLEWTTKIDTPIQLLRSRALEVFSKEDVVKIFGTPGCRKNSMITDVANSGDDGSPGPARTCDCSQQWADCPGIKTCKSFCIVPPGGGSCGFLGMYTCNGRC